MALTQWCTLYGYVVRLSPVWVRNEQYIVNGLSLNICETSIMSTCYMLTILRFIQDRCLATILLTTLVWRLVFGTGKGRRLGSHWILSLGGLNGLNLFIFTNFNPWEPNEWDLSCLVLRYRSYKHVNQKYTVHHYTTMTMTFSRPKNRFVESSEHIVWVR